jgi:hypothetical protein
VELLTSHLPTTTTIVHYTDTADLRETCAFDIQRLGDWIEAEAVIATSRPRLFTRSPSAESCAVEYAVKTAEPSGREAHRQVLAAQWKWWALKDSNLRPTD